MSATEVFALVDVSARRGRAARRRGGSAELELCKLLTDGLGMPIRRQISRYKGDADITPIGDWLLEVKRQERLQVAAWWKQACVQAELAGKRPILAYRQNHNPWRFMFRMADIADEYSSQPSGMTATMGLDEALLVIRERLSQIQPSPQ